MTTGHMAGPDIHLRKTVEVSRKPLSGVTRAKATSGILYTVLATHSAWFGHFHSQCVSGDQSTSNSVDYNFNQHLWTNMCGRRVDLYQSKDYNENNGLK